MGNLRQIRGFTLVEMAIVLTIVGLLIGGVLQGRELINTARIIRTVADLNGFQTATRAFQDKYGNLPGDLPSAVARLPGCASQPTCFDGNGNGFIDNNARARLTETRQFWKHLALAELIGGVNPNANVLVQDWNLEPGEQVPATPFGGTYMVGALAGPAFQPVTRFITFPIRGPPTVANSDIRLRVIDTYRIDTKMDNGEAGTGTLLGISSVRGISGKRSRKAADRGNGKNLPVIAARGGGGGATIVSEPGCGEVTKTGVVDRSIDYDLSFKDDQVCVGALSMF
jgi:prepilin-type N-terminal cleavage/methylation domain-containing protein